jgi:hypothetical protein
MKRKRRKRRQSSFKNIAQSMPAQAGRDVRAIGTENETGSALRSNSCVHAHTRRRRRKSKHCKEWLKETSRREGGLVVRSSGSGRGFAWRESAGALAGPGNKGRGW